MSKLNILFQEIGIKKLLRLRRWHKYVLPHVRGFYVSRCVQALDMCGVLDRFRTQGKLDLQTFCGEKNNVSFNKFYLEKVCDYLYAVGIFKKNGDVFSLSEEGEVIILNKHGYFDFIQAYSPFFFSLPEMLAGSVDKSLLHRQDIYVSKATADVSEWLPLPAVRYLVKKYSFKRILDLGCGYGELLISLASEGNLTGLYGIDLAVDSINKGKSLIAEKGLSKSVTLHEGDILKPEQWAEWSKSIQLVTIMFVMHEFLGKGLSKFT